MSKKLESIKSQVFYAIQNPHELATTIASLIADVVTSVKVTGPTIVESDTVDGATATYVGKAYSQYEDEMADAVTLTLKQAVTGVAIAEGVVTIANTVVDNTTFTVVGTCGAKTFELLVTVNVA